jgi:hypothetical protein
MELAWEEVAKGEDMYTSRQSCNRSREKVPILNFRNFVGTFRATAVEWLFPLDLHVQLHLHGTDVPGLIMDCNLEHTGGQCATTRSCRSIENERRRLNDQFHAGGLLLERTGGVLRLKNIRQSLEWVFWHLDTPVVGYQRRVGGRRQTFPKLWFGTLATRWATIGLFDVCGEIERARMGWSKEGGKMWHVDLF